MNEGGRKAVFKVSPFMLGLGRVPLEGKALDLMAPLAKKWITVGDRYGRSIRCRVGAGGCSLMGPKLAELIILENRTGFFALEQCGEGSFLIRPVTEPKKYRDGGETGRPPKNNGENGEMGYHQLPLFFEEVASRSETVVPAGRGGEKRKTGEGREVLHRPEKSPAAASAAAATKTIDAPTTATTAATAAGPGVPPAAPAIAAVHIPFEGENAGEDAVKVVFFQEEDAAVLREAEEKRRGGLSAPGESLAPGESPVSDLILHRQALQLSLSPGFDRLLVLSLVRGVEPLDYQLKTVRHVLANLRGRALLCDEVGLGKTIEAGLIMLEYILRGLVQKVLLLVPPSLVEQWQQEMQNKFGLDFIAYDAPAFKNLPSPWKEFPRIVASLDTAKREGNRDEVLGSDYDLVVVDEAHHLKNHRTLAYQLVNRLKKKYILLLTATPVENNLEELFNLITLLQPGQLETASSFKRKYITRGDPLKPKNTEALKRLIREVMIRNRRSETGVITSRRLAEVVELDLSPEEMAFYHRLTVFVRGHYTSGFSDSNDNKGTEKFILKMLQREVGSSIEAVLPTLEKMSANDGYPAVARRVFRTLAEQAKSVPWRRKAEALLQLLAGIPEKIIVFTGFQQTHSYLVDLLRRQGLNVAQIHGGLRRLEKEEQLRLFAGEAQVLVSTDTGSEGRNLHFCNVLVNYDLPWNPMRIEQRIGRIHRLGQARDVRIYNLSAAGTVESHILELLDAKINMFQLVVGELDMILGNIDEKREFEDVIMDIWARAADEEELKRGMDELGRQILSAKGHYLTVRDLDDRLLGELRPDD